LTICTLNRLERITIIITVNIKNNAEYGYRAWYTFIHAFSIIYTCIIKTNKKKRPFLFVMYIVGQINCSYKYRILFESGTYISGRIQQYFSCSTLRYNVDISRQKPKVTFDALSKNDECKFAYGPLQFSALKRIKSSLKALYWSISKYKIKTKAKPKNNIFHKFKYLYGPNI